ncbi:MAG: AAA family ATPase, partial [Parvibaculum sp.]|nr:AAA family ATPase [Parvibaculum sp.]
RRRIAAWQDYHAIEQDEEAGRRFRLVTSALPLAESVDRVIAEARFMGENGTPPDIIVIDTLSRALAGGNENDSGDMGRLVMAAERIRETTGATVLAVHHSGKDQANGARGHSLLRGAVDFEIETRKRGDLSAEIVLHKQKDGDAGLSLNVDMVSVELGHDDDGDPVTSLVPIKGDDSAPTPSKRKLPETASAGLECLRRAIAEQGQPAPASNHIPAGVSTVTKTMFRTHLELGGIINAEGNPREQMRRIIVTLKERGFIGVWGENVWTVT